uniref:Uncharacterized protein n=1 Tax=Trypanosoma vivax (strain Y486) TaxID=1055687 RepID=G0TS97_TRYVY|nr:conserved hypothetical protein [Trypanosoma vivax Y486]
MSLVNEWKNEWVTEEHVQRQRLVRSSLQRNLREVVNRRVTSSAVSPTVEVLDSCWARGQRVGGVHQAVPGCLVPYLFCALSNGEVCILNTSNFMKTYLFEDASVRRTERRRQGTMDVNTNNHSEGSTHRNRLAAIDCFATSRSTTKAESTTAPSADGDGETLVLLCGVSAGSVCTLMINSEAITHAPSSSLNTAAVQKVIELPTDDLLPERGSWEGLCVRFSPCGTRIIAVARARGSHSSTRASFRGSLEDEAQHAAFCCVLRHKEDAPSDVYITEKGWSSMPTPSGSTNAELLHIAWWDSDDSVLLSIWSDGTVSLMHVTLEGIAHTSAFKGSAQLPISRVTAATALPPSFHDNLPASRFLANTGPQLSSSVASVPNPSQEGLVAMVVDENVVVVFACCTLAEPPRKMAKSELVDANVGKGSALALHPMHQTYCSEDIPVRDVVLFDFLIPSALAVLLESGALLVLDAITMEPLATRSLPRLFPPQGGKTKRVQGEKGTGAGGDNVDADACRVFCVRLREKPMAVCLVEHNTAVVIRPS